MKKGDLVKIPEVHVEFDKYGRLVKTQYWIHAIVMEDYQGHNLLRVYLPEKKEMLKVHLSTVKLQGTP
jgi:hypothetical protein